MFAIRFRLTRVGRFALALVVFIALMPLMATRAGATPSTALTRYPYLTDSIQTSMTVNWATDTTGSTGSVQWGPPGSCAANTTQATKTAITVVSKAEYQWKATIPVAPDTTYCYRVLLGSADLLGSDPSPTFTSQVAAGSSAPFSFAVFGDWGQAYANGANPDQANVLAQMATSGARFAVMTGDTAYPGGGQKEYGDLQQAGVDQSTVFGPSFWAVPGRSLPVFNVTGNHGFTNGNVQVVNWPETNAAATSNGRYLMETYPSINGSTSKSYPSMWYAFDAGSARFYVLTAAWSDGNVGTASVYQDDRDAHWTASSAEYQWLQADLAAHPNALKFAFWHYPLYADSGGQPSDTFLQGGAGTLQGLLDQYSVAVAFNGHAHGYERNKPDSAGLVSYVLGNAGAAMGSVSGCSTFDAYALGSGGSHCGAAPAGQSVDHVYGFAKVTVNGSQVTVTPTDELGRTFDVQTYTFSTAPPDTIKPTPPTTVTATAVSTGKVALSWSGATDNVAVTGYRISRDGIQIAEQPGSATSYTDSTVAPNTTYSYTIVAIDAAANVSPPSTPVSVSTTGATDGTPPSAPTGLVASAPSSSQVNLSWTASTDNVAVAGYNVYRNGTLLQAAALSDATPPTTYTDDTAAPGSAYTYEVSAVDAAGNESTRSSVMITTPGGGGGTLTFAPVGDATVDNSQPTTSFGLTSRLTVDNSPVNDALLKFTVTGTAGCAVSKATLTLTVGSTTNDNSAYGGDAYGTSDAWTEGAVTWNSAPAATTAKLSSVPTAVSLNTAYQFDVTPLVTGDGNVNVLLASINSDGARYFSRESSTAQAPQLKVTCAGDTTPPAPPGNLTATALSGTQVSLSWTASPDPDVAAYKVFRNGSATALATLPASAGGYVDNTAVAGTTYTYQVSALDTAGNQSTRASVSVTTPTSSDFSITANPNSATVTAGNAVTSTIVTAVTSGSPQTLTLSATGLPSGASASFAPATINAGQSSTMTITTGGSTPAGSSTVQVTATAGAAAHSTTVALTVTAAQSNDFAMSVSPASLTIAAGQAGTATVTTAVASGSAEAITLSCAGQPSGVSVTLAPTSVTAGASSTMTVSVGSGVTPGTYPLTVTGTSVSATHIAPVTLTVGSSVVPRFVQSAAGTASATTTALAATFGAPTGAGNLLVATAGVYTGATNHLTSVTDSAGNTWNRIGAYSASGHNSDGELWYSAGAASVTSVTVHTAAAASIVLTVQEFSGVATASSLDTSSGTSNTSTAPSSGTIVPGSANELIVGFLSGHGNSEALTLTTPGYTALPQATTSITGSVVTVRTGYQVVSSNSAIGIAGSFPTAMYWAAGVAGFRAGP